MGLHQLSAENESNASLVERARQNGTLRGRWLLLARCAAAVLTVFLLAFFIANLPVYFAQLQTVCVHAPCLHWQLTSAKVRALQNAGLSVNLYAIFSLALSLFSALVWFAVAAFIAWRKSNDWMGLLTSLFLVTQEVLQFSGSPSIPLEYSSPVWHVPSLSLFLLDSILYFLVFSLFPNGRFAPEWMRWLVAAQITLAVIAVCLPPSFSNSGIVFTPLTTTLFLCAWASIIGGQVYRYLHVSSLTERQQTKWVVLGLIVGAVMGLVYIFPPLVFPSLGEPGSLYFLLFTPLYTIASFFSPLCFGIAILRYRLWDIDLIINRTLVYGMLTISVIGLYVLVVVGLGSFLQAQGNLGISLLATGLIAVLFHPLRDRLQRAVNRLMYGERDEPYRVLTRLGSRLEATLALESALSTIVETVAQALKLPYATITVGEEDPLTPAASFGAPRAGEGLVRLPLVAQHERVGELVLAPRTPGEAFTPADQRLLEDLSRQIGVVVYAVRLTADLKRLTVDLQHSRERLVTAREEERRRLRRDLHDGLGPQLASLTLKLETARNRLAHDPLAQTLLSDLAERTQATVADIRRLVYALRPPALDELGLISALGELTLQYSDRVAMHLDEPACLPELSAAVEVAIYRIAQEALTNVVHHAAARHGAIRLTLDEPAGWLTLAIQDDGCGLPPSRGVGVGLVSMRERAEELGGTCSIEPVESGGTRVLARLPLVLSQTTDELVVTPTGVPQQEE